MSPKKSYEQLVVYVDELEDQIKRLEGKVKFLEAWKDAEGVSYNRLLETSLRKLEEWTK